ncbi:MAG: response regulator [Elusimicrobia bacterium]|nr:response regulator [Elusimicrobiota bacterium]
MRPIRTLIIEDDPVLTDLLSSILQKENCNLQTAFSGKEGIEKISSFKPEVIILDITLPDMSGLDILKQLSEHKQENPASVLVMTVLTNKTYREKAADLGAKAYLTKPFKIQEFLSVVQNAFRQMRFQP